MKTWKPFFLGIGMLVGLTACKSDDDGEEAVIDPLAEYHVVARLSDAGHEVEVYSDNEDLISGYNRLYLRIKDKEIGKFVSPTAVSWTPRMYMADRQHACPVSALTPTTDPLIYQGYVVFQMPGNATEYWKMEVDYTIAGKTYGTTAEISVIPPADGMQTVTSFLGSNGLAYVLALMPFEPMFAVNDVGAVLFQMKDMTSFIPVTDYKITLDPRMPGMGNHGSPNNVGFTFDSALGHYTGKLSLTMTGYWKLNLKLLDTSGISLKGEDVTEENGSSSLYFEIEF